MLRRMGSGFGLQLVLYLGTQPLRGATKKELFIHGKHATALASLGDLESLATCTLVEVGIEGQAKRKPVHFGVVINSGMPMSCLFEGSGLFADTEMEIAMGHTRYSLAQSESTF